MTKARIFYFGYPHLLRQPTDCSRAMLVVNITFLTVSMRALQQVIDLVAAV